MAAIITPINITSAVEATTANLALCGWPAPSSLETLTLHPNSVIQLSM